MKTTLRNEGKIIIFSRQTEAERYTARRTALPEMIKKKKKNASGRNIMNDTKQKFGSDKYMGTYRRIFLVLISSKDI